jgi:hypothetical protein
MQITYITINLDKLHRQKLRELRRRKRALFIKKLQALVLVTRVVLSEERESLAFYGILLIGIVALCLLI